jgi:hypothetical protein
MNKKRRLFRLATMLPFILLGLAFILISGCSASEKVEHIEAFTTVTDEENEEGLFVITGYKKVNAISNIVQGKGYIKSDVKTIEDSYDLEGNFIKSEFKHSSGSKSSVTMHDDGDSRKKELKSPSTILIPDGHDEGAHSISLSEEEKKQVKEHVLSYLK